MTQSFPPKSVLRTVKSIKVDVQTQGDGVISIMDKTIKQVVQGDLSNGGVKIAYGDSDDSDAVLFCRVATLTSANDYRGRPAGYAFVINFSLMTSLPGQASDELFIIWGDVHLGCGDTGAVYEQLVSATKQLTFKLIARLQER